MIESPVAVGLLCFDCFRQEIARANVLQSRRGGPAKAHFAEIFFCYGSLQCRCAVAYVNLYAEDAEARFSAVPQRSSYAAQSIPATKAPGTWRRPGCVLSGQRCKGCFSRHHPSSSVIRDGDVLAGPWPRLPTTKPPSPEAVLRFYG